VNFYHLQQLASHGLFDVRVKAKGDTHIDDHHTNEDIALALGTALLRALGDRKGIHRFGDFTAPLDEALVHVVLVIPFTFCSCVCGHVFLALPPTLILHVHP
jgi:imidazoleglycerol phosphate dehydratase HisB